MPQYAVVAFTDGTLNVTLAGPFRSRAKALAIADRFNEASDWSEEPDIATLTAYVEELVSAESLLARANPKIVGDD